LASLGAAPFGYAAKSFPPEGKFAALLSGLVAKSARIKLLFVLKIAMRALAVENLRSWFAVNTVDKPRICD
jgi:hypothetical protein